jgi:hypothetical protein
MREFKESVSGMTGADETPAATTPELPAARPTADPHA